jgi:hypothetical protein
MQFVMRAGSAMLIGLMMAGCGGDDKKVDEVEKFIGTWKYTSGTIVTNCDGDSTTENASGNEVITRGSNSDLVVSDSDCSNALDVSGTSANGDSGESCTTSGDGLTFVQTVESLVFSTDDGKLGHVSGTFNLVVSGGGATQTCTVTLTGDLKKL